MRYAIGVDFGTESGRAVLVDLATGAELATAIHEYANGVIDRRLPAPTTTSSSSPTGPSRTPTTTSRRSGRPSRGCCPRPASTGPRSSASASTSRPARCCRRRPTARRSAASGVPPRAARLGEALEAPRRAARGRPHQRRGRAGRSVAAALRRPDLVGVVLLESLQILDEAPASTPRADRLIEAADWVVWQLTGVETRNACTAGYKAIWSRQDGFPSAGYFAALDPRFAGSSTTRCRATSARSGGAPVSSTPRRAAWTGLRPGRRSRRQRRCPRVGAGGRRDRARDDGRGHGHEHLPHGPRGSARRRRGDVRRRRGRDHPGLLRLRGRPVGRRRHLRLVHASRPCRPGPRAARARGRASTRSSSARQRRLRPGETACWRSTGGTAIARSSSTPS